LKDFLTEKKWMLLVFLVCWLIAEYANANQMDNTAFLFEVIFWLGIVGFGFVALVKWKRGY